MESVEKEEEKVESIKTVFFSLENWALMNHSETRNVYLKTYDSYIIPLERNKGPNESLAVIQSIHRKKGKLKKLLVNVTNNY